jgi:nucleoside-diphosphate-sugar epimerase
MEETSFVADVADYDAILPAFGGVASVVHLAAASATDSPWDEVLASNIIGTRNVFEAAREAGVAQVVFASSNHVVGMYEKDGAPDIYRRHDPTLIDESAEMRPDSLYGVSKAFGELIGRYYAEAHGLRVICLRIGWVWEQDEVPRDHPQAEAIWLSHRDCAQLFARAIDADDVRWLVAYGISDNARQFWSLRSAREVLGFAPQDGT